MRVHLNGATIMTTPTDRQIEVARQAGFDGVEVRAERLLDDRAELERAAAIVRPEEVWSLNGIRIGLTADGSLDVAALEADLPPRLEICRELRAAYLLAVPPRVEGLTAADATDGLREGLRRLRDVLTPADIGLAFEFLGFFDCPIRTPAAASELVEPLDGIDLVIDSCHWHASGSEPLDVFPDERLAMVHLNDAPAKEPSRIEDADRVLPGEGVIRLADLVGQLRALGYDGPWSLETFNPDYWAADPLALAEHGRTALRGLLEAA